MEVDNLDFELQYTPDFDVLAFVVDVDTYYIGHVDMVDFDYQLVDIDFDYRLVDIDFDFQLVDIDFDYLPVDIDFDYQLVDIGFVVDDIEKILRKKMYLKLFFL